MSRGFPKRNLAGIPGAPKKGYWVPTEAVRTRFTKKLSFLHFPEKQKTGLQSVSRYNNHWLKDRYSINIIYLGKGHFFLLTTLPSRGRNMVRVQKYFGLKVRFLIWDPDFCRRGVFSPRRWLRLGVGPIQIARFVSKLCPFSSGSARFAPKSLDQPHYGDTVCQ